MFCWRAILGDVSGALLTKGERLTAQGTGLKTRHRALDTTQGARLGENSGRQQSLAPSGGLSQTTNSAGVEDFH